MRRQRTKVRDNGQRRLATPTIIDTDTAAIIITRAIQTANTITIIIELNSWHDGGFDGWSGD